MREQVRWAIEPGLAAMLAFGSTVADFTLPPDPQRVLEGMARLALVQPDPGTALHVGVERPFDDEQGPFDAPDFTQGAARRATAGSCCRG